MCFMALISCSKEDVASLEEANASQNTFQDRRDGAISGIGDPTTDLIAGQTIDVGSVDVTYDGTYIYVTYTTENGWELDETHLYIGDCEERPANNPGNPLIGQFPYAEEHDNGTTSYTYVLDASEIGISGCVAAHAVVSDGTGNSETAWGDGQPYGGNSWAMFFYYDFN